MKTFCKPEQGLNLRVTADFARLVALVVGLLLGALNHSEAAPAAKLIKPGRLMIDGLPVKCGSTPALISQRFADYGSARRGLIILNPVKMSQLSRDAKLLIYYHECAHQYVGASELAADCWAIQKVRRDGLIDRAGLKNACSFINSLPANRRHPPGAMRCRHMTRCYNNTFRRKADNQQLKNRLSDVSSLGFSHSTVGSARSSRQKIQNNKQASPLH